MALADKKVLMVLPERGFQEKDYQTLRQVLEWKGVRVTVASTRPGELHGMKGGAVRADAVVGDVKYYDYDAIVFVGGDSVSFSEDKAVLKLAEDAKYKVLGAISDAPAILAKAGVLKDKKTSGDRGISRLLEAYGARYTGQPVEVDDKIVTADGTAAEMFGNALLRTMDK